MIKKKVASVDWPTWSLVPTDLGRPVMSVASGVKSTSYKPAEIRLVSLGSLLQRQQAAIVPFALIRAQALTRPLLWSGSFEKRLVTLPVLACKSTALAPSSFLRRSRASPLDPPSLDFSQGAGASGL
jgi:hypothetical protein